MKVFVRCAHVPSRPKVVAGGTIGRFLCAVKRRVDYAWHVLLSKCVDLVGEPSNLRNADVGVRRTHVAEVPY